MAGMKEKEARHFGKRLAEMRKRRGLTQQQLCELVSTHVSQLRNYESDRSQPTLDVIRRLALALDVTADELVFDPAERLPLVTDKELVKQWESVEGLPDEDKQVVKKVIAAMIVKQRVEAAMR